MRSGQAKFAAWGFNSEKEKEEYIRWKVNDAKEIYLAKQGAKKQKESEQSDLAELFEQLKNTND